MGPQEVAPAPLEGQLYAIHLFALRVFVYYSRRAGYCKGWDYSNEQKEPEHPPLVELIFR